MEDLFDTDVKKLKAVEEFRNLLNNPGWQLLVKVVNANIEFIKTCIIDGVEDETKESIDHLRARLKTYENVVNTPADSIRAFTEGKPAPPIIDPFQTVEELKKERRE